MILLLPIGYIGCGKTTLGKILQEKYNIRHIENDEFKNKWYKEILNNFLKYDIIFADKNNHLFSPRNKLCTDIKEKYPECKIISIVWEIQDKNKIFNITYKRVKQRKNHKTLSNDNPKLVCIIKNILYRRDNINENEKLNDIIHISINDDVDTIINKITDKINNQLIKINDEKPL